MQSYLQCLKQRPSTESVQLAGCTLLHFLFLLLHALQASHRHLHSTQPDAKASTSASSTSAHLDKHELQAQLPNLTDNAIGDVTCADAQWCPVDVILQRISKTLFCWPSVW